MNEDKQKEEVAEAEAELVKENAKMYAALLKAHMFSEELTENEANISMLLQEATGEFSGPVFTFKRKEYRINSIIKPDRNPIAAVRHEFLFPRDLGASRKLPQAPYKVLDAPGLRDDFYLNTVDWSSTDILAVGLNRTLYTLRDGLSKVDLALDFPGDDEITALSFSPSGGRLFLGYGDGLAQVVDVEAGKVVTSYSGHVGRITCGSWCSDWLFSTGARDSRILDHDIRVHAPFIKVHKGHKQEVCNIRWNCDGRVLASGGNDNKVFLWNLHHSSPLSNLSGHSAAVKALAWSPLNSNLLATGGGVADRSIKVWDCVDAKCLRSTDTGSQVCNLLFSGDGEELVSGHGYVSNALSLWVSSSLTRAGTIAGHCSRVLHLAASPDGESVVTGAGDETLKFWRLFAKAKGEKSEVLACAGVR